MRKPRIALFIDAENTSPSHLPECLERCRSLGKPTIARCYGNAAALKIWEAVIAKNHLLPIQTPPGASKANASDFALTIDVVSLLHRDLYDHAVIASSDADFTLLAIHVREHGRGIDGIGKSKARPSLKSAFDNFTIVGVREVAKPAPKPATKKAVSKAAPKAVAKNKIDTLWLLSIFDDIRKSAEFCDVQALGRALAAANPNYKKGHRTLDNYLKNSGLFDIKDKNAYRLAGPQG